MKYWEQSRWLGKGDFKKCTYLSKAISIFFKENWRYSLKIQRKLGTLNIFCLGSIIKALWWYGKLYVIFVIKKYERRGNDLRREIWNIGIHIQGKFYYFQKKKTGEIALKSIMYFQYTLLGSSFKKLIKIYDIFVATKYLEKSWWLVKVDLKKRHPPL